MRWILTAAVSALAMAGPKRTLEVRLAPGDFLVLNPTNPGRGYADLVLHAAAVRAGGGERCRLEKLRVELSARGVVRLTEDLPIEQVAADTRALAQAPVFDMVAGQVLNAGGLPGLFGAPTVLAKSPDLRPGEALVSVRHHYSVGFTPDEIRAVAACRRPDGSRVRAQATAPVRAWHSAIEYRSPLHGTWLMQETPTVESHHRLNPSTEFASDFYKIDADGHAWNGDRMAAASWYGWGQPVSAVADGIVTMVIADQVQDRSAFAPRPGETPDQAGERIEAMALARMKANFAAANAGNIVVIRHEMGGATEYSAYGHLKPGSVRVKVGDHVTQGATIGEIGDTGDTPVVHLHFQINAGPDPFSSRSLPFAFSDLEMGSGGELGRIVKAP